MQTDITAAMDNGSNEFSALIINLLKGPVHANDKPQLWETLLQRQSHIKSYLSVMNLSLYLDEAEGFAFIKPEADDGDQDERPRLVSRRPLGFGLSVLCLLLRKWLAEHDTQAGDVRAIIAKDLVQSELELFLPMENSEKKRADRIDKYIKQAAELGLVKLLGKDGDVLEIQRITKAIINADWLGDLAERLEQYRSHAGKNEDEPYHE